MAPDGLVYFVMQPSGYLLIATLFVISFIMWRLTLGKMYTQIGAAPLVLACLCAILGLVIFGFAIASQNFDSDLLPSEERGWRAVAGGTIYMALLFLPIATPFLTLLAAPFSAFLIRRQRFTHRNTAITSVAAWLLLTALFLASPLNEWEQTHRLGSAMEFVMRGLLIVAFFMVPFFIGIHLGLRLVAAVRH